MPARHGHTIRNLSRERKLEGARGQRAPRHLELRPQRDTPEALASYAHAAIADPDGKRKVPWSFLTTRSKADLKPILEHYGQPVAPRHGSDQLNHLLRLYLIDRKGQIRNIYGLGMLDPRFLLADIESLLLEDGTLGPKRQ